MTVGPKEICRGAAEYIRRYGLHKGELFDPVSKACCTIGAMNMAAFADPFGDEESPMNDAFNEALDRVRQLMPEGLYVADWNDIYATPEKAVWMLERAAKTFELQEAVR